VSGFLLDTNVISELVKPRPEKNVTEWIESTNESLLYLSVLTLGEIRRGIAALPQSRRRAILEGWLNNDLRSRFEGRILVIDQNAYWLYVVFNCASTPQINTIQNPARFDWEPLSKIDCYRLGSETIFEKQIRSAITTSGRQACRVV
jgi:PIN domain